MAPGQRDRLGRCVRVADLAGEHLDQQPFGDPGQAGRVVRAGLTQADRAG